MHAAAAPHTHTLTHIAADGGQMGTGCSQMHRLEGMGQAACAAVRPPPPPPPPCPSHSFAVVIQQLPSQLRDAICVFYLVLRGLDTVEDDMAIPIPDKLPVLKAFHERIYKRWGVRCSARACV